MDKKKYNITITTVNSTEDYSCVTYESKKDRIVIFKNSCIITYPICNVVRIVVREA